MTSEAVVFIPGAKGTKLVNTNTAEFDTIWSGVQYNFETMQSLNVYPAKADQPNVGNYFDMDHVSRSDNGDGRVPHVSSCAYFDKITTLMVSNSFFHREYSHGFFLKDERAQRIIRRFLTQEDFDFSSPGRNVKKVTRLIPANPNGDPDDGVLASDWAVALE